MKAKSTSRRQTSRSKPAPQATTPSPKPLDLAALHEQITKRAHEIYEQRIHRGPLDDWLQAEQEILARQEPRS